MGLKCVAVGGVKFFYCSSNNNNNKLFAVIYAHIITYPEWDYFQSESCFFFFFLDL